MIGTIMMHVTGRPSAYGVMNISTAHPQSSSTIGCIILAGPGGENKPSHLVRLVHPYSAKEVGLLMFI